MSLNDDTMMARVALRHSVSLDAVKTALEALRGSGGAMAQFSHPDFGGMVQWSRGGMTMVGDMFNNDMKAKLDAVCSELAAYLANTASSEKASQDRNEDVSYRSKSSPQSSWWPNGLGEPSSVGSQNDMRYAVFPSSGRLAISDGGAVEVYDTASHKISGVAQAQSSDQTLIFSGQDGLVRVSDLTKVST